jgi:hypothetical protein
MRAGYAQAMKITQRIRTAAGWPDDEIGGIGSRGVDILVVKRPPPVDCSEAVKKARLGEERLIVSARTARSKIGRALARFDLDLRPACSAKLADDMADLALGFMARFEQKRVELRIDLADEQSCPKFHCDNVDVRMVTTYAGPGTEYVYANEPGTIHRAAPGALVFLKGHRHPTHTDSVHHRSPPVRRGVRRLTLAIDFEDWLTALQ